MCGICGLVRFDGSPIDQARLDRLTDALAHRGPDGRGTFVAGSVGLGHRRLSILDLSAAASQPMLSADRMTALTFNGEIYNFADKRKLLESKGYAFTSTGDTEVLLKLYEEFGDNCVKHLRGQFAFAILDQKRGTLLLARDRVGKKPLKYFVDGGTFAFASELKALRTLKECPTETDWEAVHHYLTMMYVPSPQTGIKGICKLPAAHCMRLDLKTGQQTVWRYWELSYTEEKHSEADWKHMVMDTLDESVRLRMVADVPVGAFLSGGVDSAAVTALMARHSSRPVETFSIGSPEETHNELPGAQRMAELLKTNHHPIVLKPDVTHLLGELVEAYEEPFADPSVIPTYLLSRETRKHVTVALNGDGGDENFAGYVRYPILKFSKYWASQFAPVHMLTRTFTGVFHGLRGTTLSYRMYRFQSTIGLPWSQRYLQYISFFTEEEKRALYKQGFGTEFARTDLWYSKRTADARARGNDLIHKAMSMDLDTYLADDLLPKVDLGSMASSLEARSPLLDHELLELTSRMPSSLKLKGFSKKHIFKKMLRGMVPDETRDKKKTGFRLPLDRWFRTDCKTFVDDRLRRPDSKLWQMLDRGHTGKFLDDYHRSAVDYSDHVWALLWLDEWLARYT